MRVCILLLIMLFYFSHTKNPFKAVKANSSGQEIRHLVYLQSIVYFALLLVQWKSYQGTESVWHIEIFNFPSSCNGSIGIKIKKICSTFRMNIWVYIENQLYCTYFWPDSSVDRELACDSRGSGFDPWPRVNIQVIDSQLYYILAVSRCVSCHRHSLQWHKQWINQHILQRLPWGWWTYCSNGWPVNSQGRHGKCGGGIAQRNQCHYQCFIWRFQLECNTLVRFWSL